MVKEYDYETLIDNLMCIAIDYSKSILNKEDTMQEFRDEVSDYIYANSTFEKKQDKQSLMELCEPNIERAIPSTLDTLAERFPKQVLTWVLDNFECTGKDITTGEFEIQWK